MQFALLQVTCVLSHVVCGSRFSFGRFFPLLAHSWLHLVLRGATGRVRLGDMPVSNESST